MMPTNKLTDEEIAKLLRPLYASDRAAEMGLSYDLKTVRAIEAAILSRASDAPTKPKGHAMSREVMQQALDALEDLTNGHSTSGAKAGREAIAALRAELAKDAEPVGYFAYNANWRTWENVVSAAREDADVIPLFAAQPDYAAGVRDGLEQASKWLDAEDERQQEQWRKRIGTQTGTQFDSHTRRHAAAIRALKGE